MTIFRLFKIDALAYTSIALSIQDMSVIFWTELLLKLHGQTTYTECFRDLEKLNLVMVVRF